MQEPIIIVGDSPFLKEVEDKIYYLLNRYKSMGINRTIHKFKTTYHIFTDLSMVHSTNSNPDIKSITLASYGDLITNPRKELVETFTFDVDNGGSFINDGKLAWCGFTHDYAISYCIWKGFTNIILLGAADFTNKQHFSCSQDFTYSELLKTNSIKYIEEYCTKWAQIRTCNPNSILNIPKVNINDLLK